MVVGTSAPEITAPSRSGSYVARLVAPTAIRSAPGSGTILMRINPATAPATLLALGETTVNGRRYIKVHMSRRGRDNGWLPASNVLVGREFWWVELVRNTRRLTLYSHGKRVLSVRVVVGAPATPTPLGLFAVHHITRNDSSSVLGPYTIQLTAFSDVLHEFAGGPGRIAMHGMRGALVAPAGSAVSHGCIRIRNQKLKKIAARVRAGTPMYIRVQRS